MDVNEGKLWLWNQRDAALQCELRDVPDYVNRNVRRCCKSMQALRQCIASMDGDSDHSDSQLSPHAPPPASGCVDLLCWTSNCLSVIVDDLVCCDWVHRPQLAHSASSRSRFDVARVAYRHWLGSFGGDDDVTLASIDVGADTKTLYKSMESAAELLLRTCLFIRGQPVDIGTARKV